jgi:coatomer subunit beta
MTWLAGRSAAPDALPKSPGERMASFEKNCTFLVGTPERDEASSREELMRGLEAKSDEVKISTLKRIITTLAQGEDIPGILMHVIRFCINTKNHELQKLLMIYWEILEKHDASGKPLSELLLVV